MKRPLPAHVSQAVPPRGTFHAVSSQAWKQLDPQEYPSIHAVIDEFIGHDDADQFRAGLDLIMAGLRQQADGV